MTEKSDARFKSQFIPVGFFDQDGNVVLATIDYHVPNGEKAYLSSS